MKSKRFLEFFSNPRFLWAVVILAGVNIFINTSDIPPNDFWWHMAIGRDILQSGQIPLVDTYTHTMLGAPYPSYQVFWLMDLWLYGWYSLGGAELVLFVHSLVITSAYTLIFYTCWKVSQHWGAATFALAMAILFGFYTWNVRPQAISFLYGAIFLLAIYSYRLKPNKAWLAV